MYQDVLDDIKYVENLANNATLKFRDIKYNYTTELITNIGFVEFPLIYIQGGNVIIDDNGAGDDNAKGNTITQSNHFEISYLDQPLPESGDYPGCTKTGYLMTEQVAPDVSNIYLTQL